MGDLMEANCSKYPIINVRSWCEYDVFIQLTGFGRWTKCQFICLWWVIFLWIIHSYLIRDTNKKMLKTLYFVWSSGSPLFYLFDFILSERACHGSDEWDSTRSAYRVSLRKKGCQQTNSNFINIDYNLPTYSLIHIFIV